MQPRGGPCAYRLPFQAPCRLREDGQVQGAPGHHAHRRERAGRRRPHRHGGPHRRIFDAQELRLRPRHAHEGLAGGTLQERPGLPAVPSGLLLLPAGRNERRGARLQHIDGVPQSPLRDCRSLEQAGLPEPRRYRKHREKRLKFSKSQHHAA